MRKIFLDSGKLKPFIIHICISIIFAAGAVFLINLWYPGNYLYVAAGINLILLVVIVDCILGPFLTLLIYHKRKSKKEIFLDFSVIAVLQIVALTYGLWSAYIARPVYLVFEYQRMMVVSAIDILEKELNDAPAEFRYFPKDGPKLLSLRPFKNANEQYDSVMRAVGGQPQAAQPELWQSYDAGRQQIVDAAKPLEFLETGAVSLPQLQELIAESGRSKDQLKYLPLVGRSGEWIFIIDASNAEPKGMIALRKD